MNKLGFSKINNNAVKLPFLVNELKRIFENRYRLVWFGVVHKTLEGTQKVIKRHQVTETDEIIDKVESQASFKALKRNKDKKLFI